MLSRHNRWRMYLDPRDPDYIEPPKQENETDEPDDYPTDSELDCFAAEAENRWRPTA